MYKYLIIVGALAFITACTGNTKDDVMMMTANNSYNAARTVISKAKSYDLNVSHAEKSLAKAGALKKEGNYTESIAASESANKLASEAINKHKAILTKKEAAKRAQAEQARIARAEAERLKMTGREYVVQTGDNLGNIAASSAELNNDRLLWSLIFYDNKTAIKVADLIHPEMTLKIKPSANNDLLEKARRHTQTRGYWAMGTLDNSTRYYLQQQ